MSSRTWGSRLPLLLLPMFCMWTRCFSSIIFIQECLLSQGRLDALVRPLGYVSVLAAAAEGTGRRLVCLYRAGLVVTSVDLEPGFV